MVHRHGGPGIRVLRPHRRTCRLRVRRRRRGQQRLIRPRPPRHVHTTDQTLCPGETRHEPVPRRNAFRCRSAGSEQPLRPAPVRGAHALRLQAQRSLRQAVRGPHRVPRLAGG
ncbi:hypothetical protein ACFFX0_02220 [Citricoccus parietis]|uniref:Uncharacterized protein n=1 Tax=Citricoccus parietis TaxID=592307 RepID=A0ABV5FTQ7_9MICC